MDTIKNIQNLNGYFDMLKKYQGFIAGLLIVIYIYSTRSSSSNTSLQFASRNGTSRSRMILLMILAYYFRTDIMKLLHLERSSKVKESVEYSKPAIYKYGTDNRIDTPKTETFERNLSNIWKTIKQYKKTSPELVKDLYIHFQHFQYEVKALKKNKEEGYLHQHFDKLVDRKTEIMNLLESLEYTENIDMSLLKKDVSDFLHMALLEAKERVNETRINASSGLIHIEEDVYSRT